MTRDPNCSSDWIIALTAAERVRKVDATTRERLWKQIAPASRRAATRARRRAAWRTLLDSPWFRAGLLTAGASAAVGLLTLLLAGRGIDQRAPAERHQATSTVRAPKAAPSARPKIAAVSSERSVGAPASQRAKKEQVAVLPSSPSSSRRWRKRRSRLASGAWFVARGRVKTLRDRRDRSELQLASGYLAVDAPRLRASSRITVRTPDALIWVKGTRFSVRRDPLQEATIVTVTEGRVWIEPAGRNRARLELGPNEQRTVLGEAAYLRQLLHRLDQAILERDFGATEQHARRYLEATNDRRAATTIRLRLAGALMQLGRDAEAIRIYRAVSRGGQASQTARQNALAFLAQLQQRRGDKSGATRSWYELLDRFPRGLHQREASLSLVKLTCRQRTVEGSGARAALTSCCAGDGEAEALLRACSPDQR